MRVSRMVSVVAVAVSLLALAIPASGQEDREAERRRPSAEALVERLKAMDKNRDDKVSREEYRGPQRAFSRLDPDGDGVIDLSRPPAPGRREGDRPGRREGDRPGRRPSPEAAERARVQRIFDQLDRDGDGKLSISEFAPFARRALAGRLGEGDARRRPGGRTILANVIRRFDRNRDGRVTRDEFDGRESLFARLDRNRDGVLDRRDVRVRRDAPGDREGERRGARERGDRDSEEGARRDVRRRGDREGDEREAGRRDRDRPRADRDRDRGESPERDRERDRDESPERDREGDRDGDREEDREGGREKDEG